MSQQKQVLQNISIFCVSSLCKWEKKKTAIKRFCHISQSTAVYWMECHAYVMLRHLDNVCGFLSILLLIKTVDCRILVSCVELLMNSFSSVYLHVAAKCVVALFVCFNLLPFDVSHFNWTELASEYFRWSHKLKYSHYSSVVCMCVFVCAKYCNMFNKLFEMSNFIAMCVLGCHDFDDPSEAKSSYGA